MTTVDTDMDENTVTVGFEDGETSIDDIIKALGEAGFTVSSYAPET